jgi:hypothetical protein
MNERMLELYRQAQVPDTAIDPSNNMPYETTTFSADKFAELIVGECLALSKSQLVSIPDNQEDWDGHNYGFTAAVCEFEDLVKEHFGVEK